MKQTSEPREPMREQAIRPCACELYVQRGKTNGHAVYDWLKAEANCAGSIARLRLNITTGLQTFVWSRHCMME
jgi:hypothetical protein